MAEKLYAIRAQNPGGFRRSGERFTNDVWRIIKNPDKAILNESALVKVDLHAEDVARQLGPLKIENEELMPKGITAAPSDAAGLRDELNKAQSEIKELKNSEDLRRYREIIDGVDLIVGNRGDTAFDLNNPFNGITLRIEHSGLATDFNLGSDFTDLAQAYLSVKAEMSSWKNGLEIATEEVNSRRTENESLKNENATLKDQVADLTKQLEQLTAPAQGETAPEPAKPAKQTTAK